MVGAVPDTVPDASVHHHDGASNRSLGYVSLPKVYCTARIWFYGFIVDTVLAVLQQQASQRSEDGCAEESLVQKEGEGSIERGIQLQKVMRTLQFVGPSCCWIYLAMAGICAMLHQAIG